MKIKKLIFFNILIFSFLIFTSCEYGLHQVLHRIDEVNSRSSKIYDLNTFAVEKLKEDVAAPIISSEKFAVLVFSDVHFGRNAKKQNRRHDEEFISYVLQNKNQLEKFENSNYPLQFVICAGDVVEHGYKSEYVDYHNFCVKIQTDLNLKVYTVAGNHDLFNSGWNYWETYCYPHTSSYTFKTTYNKKTLEWIFLDSGSGTLGNKQLNEVKKILSSSSNEKIVITHYPVYAGGLLYFTMQNVTERDTLISEFAKGNVKLLVDGHHHFGGEWDFGDFFHEENIKSYLDYKSFSIIYVDLNSKKFNIKQVEF